MLSNHDIPPTFGIPISESGSDVQEKMLTRKNSQSILELYSQPGDLLDAGTIEHEIIRTSDKFRYNMNHRNRGNFVIFNHENFDIKGAGKRDGTNMDRNNLYAEAGKLGFNVFTHEDLTLKDILEKVEEYAQMDYRESDCFACAILTHGGEGDQLYAKDEKYHLNKIFFPIRDCPTLKGKPKLFFIQACRGQKLDHGVKTDSPDANGIGDEFTQTDDLIIPTEADFLIGYSTVQGYYAWRNGENGSWFIQALCFCLGQHGDSMEIMQIMTRVNRMVAHDYESHAETNSKFNKKKQMPSFVTRLTRCVYFSLTNNAMEIETTDGQTPQHRETVKKHLEKQEHKSQISLQRKLIKTRLELVTILKEKMQVKLHEQDVLKQIYEQELELLK